MTDVLTRGELDALERWTTPAIANAIELFDLQPRSTGFMHSEVNCRFPDMPVAIGYAATAVISAEMWEGRRVPPPEWWEAVKRTPSPKLVVMHDLDRPVIGSFWGEVNANIHK